MISHLSSPWETKGMGNRDKITIFILIILTIICGNAGLNSRHSFTSLSGKRIELQQHLFEEKLKAEGRNATESPISTTLSKDDILEELGAWDYWGEGGVVLKRNEIQGDEATNLDSRRRKWEELEGGLSRVKLIPESHHVSAFLNKGVTKRFLYINEQAGSSLSITITPCTSILLWSVKFWPITENGNGSTNPNPLKLGQPLHLKTYRTQRPVSFKEGAALRGVYSVDIRPINWDSYVHFYASSSADGQSQSHAHFRAEKEKFYQHIFAEVEATPEPHPRKEKKRKRGLGAAEIDLNFPDSDGNFVNTNLENLGDGDDFIRGGHSPLVNKPRIWTQRLRGHRLHVRWDTSPVNPHRMSYCLVINSRRDYSSLCSATGERFGVLPPDLLHVSYYGDGSQYAMIDNATSHKHRHGHGHDIVIGCVGKRTNYILGNLAEGRLYYFNVFLRDGGTNVSYPYVRTTLKYHSPKNVPSTLRDGKPKKVKLSPNSSSVVKFNLNKPCSELTLYVMPCGGGSITFQVLHQGNRSVYNSEVVDSLDIIKIAEPSRGRYYVNISSNASNNVAHLARMAEVYVAKKNRRLPLPKLPAIIKLSEDVSQRTCDSVTLQWWPSPDPRDNEYCIFLKEEKRNRKHFNFKPPNQCDVLRSLRADPYVTHSLCTQKDLQPETMLHSQKLVGLGPGRTYVVQLVLKRHNGKALSYNLDVVRTLATCDEDEK